MTANILSEQITDFSQASLNSLKNEIKERMQEIILAGLSEAGFFREATFNGGTALRIFHGLNRFSEDLDFSLKSPSITFSFDKYFAPIERKLSIYGINVSIEKKEKSIESSMQTAYVKCNARDLLQKVLNKEPPFPGTSYNEAIKIKLEIDTNPPAFATFEIKMGLFPNAYEATLYDLPSLFAGKLHALLCRKWGNKVKGRDFYDYIWYLQHKIDINYANLEARLKQSGDLDENLTLSHNFLIELLIERFKTVDFKNAILDVTPFVSSKESLAMWNSDFFINLTKSFLP